MYLNSLDELRFDNSFVRELPGDTESANFRRHIKNACYSKVLPTPVAQPQLVAYARDVADLLDLPASVCESEDFADVFTGNRIMPGMEPYASCYGGHQFGFWAGQLGDGRAINLGEIINRKGERWTLQLKGAGLTPYSRTADGLAVLRSSIREFLCSEAMFHLGVPTTRALSVSLTGEQVVRDMFYNGHPKNEPGAVVCRVAPSFTRFGHFQILAARKEFDLLKQFVNYTLRTDFPQLGEPGPAVYTEWFKEVCRLTADMIVEWQRVGFVHGVMNTDNMSILGLTIDYGPYGWLDNYDPDWTPNTTDASERRYRFGQQPEIAYWNLNQLANALYPLFNEVAPLESGLKLYIKTYKAGWQKMMAAKLGLVAFKEPDDEALIIELLSLLQSVETDMTIFFRLLADWQDSDGIAHFYSAYYVPDQLDDDYRARLQAWLSRYQARLQQDARNFESRRQAMNAVNPNYILRNYLAQLAIDQAEQGDFSLVRDLLEVLRKPYDEQPGHVAFAGKRPDWARQRPGCSMLSCSS